MIDEIAGRPAQELQRARRQRAGGGEELGGLRGLSLYMQRCALQGARAFVEGYAGVAPPKAT